MARAILLAGSEYVFLREAAEMRQYLNREAGISDVAILRMNGMTSVSVMAWLIEQELRTEGQTVLLAYFGHGQPWGWNYDREGFILYSVLVKWIARFRNRILFLNNCCYSYSLAQYLESASIDGTRFGLLTSSEAHRVGYQLVLLQVLFDCWRGSQIVPDCTLMIHGLEAKAIGWVRIDEGFKKWVKSLFGRIGMRILEFIDPMEFKITHFRRWGASFDCCFYARKPQKKRWEGG